MRKQLTYGILLVTILVVLCTSIIVWKRAAIAPTSTPSQAADINASPSSTAPVPTAKTPTVIVDRAGKRRAVDVVNQTGTAPLLPMKELFSIGGTEVLEPISTGTKNLVTRDTETNTLRSTPAAAHLLIGRSGTELIYFVSTRYAKDSYRTELNEIRAFDLKTRQERTIDTLSPSLSYAKSIDGPNRTPRWVAALRGATVRAEVFFESAFLMPGEERLPIEIHTRSLTASTTRP